jgi:hypothetical protein
MSAAIWSECDCCDDFVCSIHEEHVADCLCPGIDLWSMTEWYPYDDVATPEILAWVAAHPYGED